MCNYILKGHEPVKEPDLHAWGRWFEKAKRHVAVDEFKSVKVSTVFLGIDHQFGDGPPLLFETMVFGGKHDDYCERYSTWDEAAVGHARICRMVMKS